MTILRVLLHVAAQRDYELHPLDFSTAFLQGSLHEEIWLRRTPGFTELFPGGTQWSLQRPVYGLCQAPREWHNTLRTTLAGLGFAPSTADPSLFLRTDTTLPPFYVLVYVEDLVFAIVDTEALAHVKSELQKRHTCTDLGELTSYLGLRITRDRAQRTITLTQSHMVQQVFQRFGLTYSSPLSTPTGHSLSAPPLDQSVESSGPYPKLVGCLIYLMTCTRPDLAYPLSILARYVTPGRHRKEHMDADKRVLRYLCSTSGMGFLLGGRARVFLTGHTDASWVDDLATQRSSQGYTFSLGSGSVSWRSTRLSSVLSSNCEAEIYAGAMATQELRWLTYLLTDLGEAPCSPPVLYVDNKAMLALCQEHRVEHRTKPIALRMRGDVVTRPELALPFLIGLVTSCFLLDIKFDELVPFYCLFPYRSDPPLPPPLFLAPGPPLVDPLTPQGPAPSGVFQVDPLPGTVPVEITGDSGAARGATSGSAEPGGSESEGVVSGGAEHGGAEPGGAETTGVEPGGVEPKGVKPRGAESKGAESGGAEPPGTASTTGPVGASPRLSPWPEPLSPQQLRDWFAQRTRLRTGAPGAGDPAAGDTGARGARGTTGVGGTGGAGVTAVAAGSGGARTRGTGSAGTGGVGGAGVGDPTEPRAAESGGAGARGPRACGAGAGGTGAGGARAGGAGAVHPRAGGAGAGGTGVGGTTGGLTERRCEPVSRPASPVCIGHCIPHSPPPPVPGTHAMALCPSSVPLHVPLAPPPESSLLGVPDLESNRARVASPIVPCLLATVVTDPSFQSTAVSALVAELVDFAAACRLDYATALVAESESATPPFVRGECVLGTDVLKDRQEYFTCLAAAVPRFASMLLAH
ncbi:unnamed protein product [Closterium sp. NIES-54]